MQNGRHEKAPSAPTLEAHEAERKSTRKNVMANNSTAKTNVIPFDFRGHSVRAVTIHGEPWFVASDVCRVLDVANTTQAMQALDDDERSMLNIGRQGDANIVNESGLYTLILRSRDAVKKGSKPHAFRKWVTSEVLPAVRKNGRYEESAGKMATLIGQTIGTDGFHMLGAVVKGKVSGLPASVQRRATAKIWSQAHAAFGVRSAADIPAEQLDAARNFIAAYSLEGQYLPKETEAQFGLSKTGRYLLSFNHKGEQQITQVPDDAYVLSQDEFLKGISHVPGDIPISVDGLFEFAITAMNNLRLRAQSRARGTFA